MDNNMISPRPLHLQTQCMISEQRLHYMSGTCTYYTDMCRYYTGTFVIHVHSKGQVYMTLTTSLCTVHSLHPIQQPCEMAFQCMYIFF